MPRSLRRSLPPVVLGALALAAGVSALDPAPARAQLPEPVEEVVGGRAVEDPPPEGEGEEEARRGFFPTAPPEDVLLTREIFDPRSWPDLGWRFLARLVDWLPSLLAALLVLIAFFVLHRVVAGILRRLMARTRADPAVQDIAARLSKYAILGLGLVMAASQLGINVASLLAGVGILGLALGLAAQDSLSNLVAGLTILWDRPFRIGDHVTVSGTFGKVQEVTLRTTRIRTVDQLDAILPNKEIINQQIVNHTLNPMMRLGIPLGIGYREDTRRAREVLLAAVQGHELLLEKPEAKVVVTALAESSVNLELRVWLRDPYTEREATFAMIELAKIALDEAGIEIPFPQRTLHLPEGLRVVGSRERDDLDEGEREPGA
jgi:small conductance mechanosensitive channel